GLDERAEVVERGVVKEQLIAGTGQVDRSLVGQWARRTVDPAARPLELGAGEVDTEPPQAHGQEAATQLDRAVPRGGERPRISDGLAAGEVERGPLAEVERRAHIGTGAQGDLIPLGDVEGRPDERPMGP